MPLAQANDALGYISQSVEMSPDSSAIDRCFGDAVLENTIALLEGREPPVK